MPSNAITKFFKTLPFVLFLLVALGLFIFLATFIFSDGDGSCKFSVIYSSIFSFVLGFSVRHLFFDAKK